MKKDLNRDLSWAAAIMGVPAAVDELHMPMLEYKTGRKGSRFEGRDAPGSAALRVWVPDFSQLSWPDVIALHDHDAIGSFREKLVEAEQAIAGIRDEERETALRDFYLAELADKVADLLPSRKRIGLEVGSSLAVDALTHAISFAGTAASAIKFVAE
jgi:hypothetical protein